MREFLSVWRLFWEADGPVYDRVFEVLLARRSLPVFRRGFPLSESAPIGIDHFWA